MCDIDAPQFAGLDRSRQALCALTFDISGRRRAQPFDCPLDGRVSALPRSEPGWHGREKLGPLHLDFEFVFQVGPASTSATPLELALCSIVRLCSSLHVLDLTVQAASFLPEAGSGEARQRLRRERSWRLNTPATRRCASAQGQRDCHGEATTRDLHSAAQAATVRWPPKDGRPAQTVTRLPATDDEHRRSDLLQARYSLAETQRLHSLPHASPVR